MELELKFKKMERRIMESGKKVKHKDLFQLKRFLNIKLMENLTLMNDSKQHIFKNVMH